MDFNDRISAVLSVISDYVEHNPKAETFKIPKKRFKDKGLNTEDVSEILAILKNKHDALEVEYPDSISSWSRGETISWNGIYIIKPKLNIKKLEAEYNRRLKSVTSAKLEPNSYDAANGVLNMYGERIDIIKQPNKKGEHEESKQAQLMRALFSVKTFPNAVPVRQIYPVKTQDYPPKVIKQANALVAAINGRIKEKLPVNKVINHDKFKFYIEDRYL